VLNIIVTGCVLGTFVINKAKSDYKNPLLVAMGMLMENRVTRLGYFRLLSDCLLWADFLNLPWSIFWPTLFHGKNLCINFDENGLGDILGYFFTKLVWSPLRRHCSRAGL
jgi:hypothetical protein